LRMTEMEAAVALEQFKKLPVLNTQRQELAECLNTSLDRLPFLEIPAVREEGAHVYYMYALKFNAVEAGFSREAFVEAMLAEGCFARAGYVRPTYLEPLYQKKICFGKDGFPFSANNRNHEISYQKGICPVCENIQDEQLVITTIMQPPQTENDMTLFAEACEKVASNRSLLSRHNMKKIA
jgi:perosamine synthetase